MAAACDVGEGEETGAVSEELLEAQIVAQAITELQEIQAPTTQISGPEIIDASVLTSLTNSVDSVGEGIGGQTHVIYYIEDGAITKSEDRKFVDTSVQANDYDIERRSGRLPARRRVIPHKFRDFKNTSDPETSDSDFDPHDYVKSKIPKVRKTGIHMRQKDQKHGEQNKRSRAGRPKKISMPMSAALQSFNKPVNIDEEISNQIEEKYQLALKIAQEESLKKCTKEGEIIIKTEGGDDAAESNDDENTIEEEKNMKVEGDLVLPVRKGPGRPRGPDWGSDFKCPDCGKIFKIKGNLRMHLRTHLNVRPFLCTEENCGKSFSSNEGLRRHYLTHQGIKPFECEVCNASFSSNLSLTEHRTSHFDQKLYECSHCQRKCRHISSFRRHLMTHSSQQPFECPVCHKRFAQSPYLRSHMKVHTGEKKYQCPICQKRFAYQSDVKRHRTTHTGEKPYQCSKCTARFSDVSSKGRHEKEHENIKRFTCALCNDTFKRSGQLHSHLVRKHGQSLTVKLQRNTRLSGGAITFQLGDDMNSVNIGQQRIVSLIKNLHNKTSPSQQGFVEVDNVPQILQLSENENQQTDVSMVTGQVGDHVTDISQLEKEVDSSVIEGDMVVPIELQGVEIQGGDPGHTYITITDFGEALANAQRDGSQETKYRVMYEIDTSGEQRQILVPYNEADDTETLELDYNTANLIQSNELEVTGATETIIESLQQTTSENMDEIAENTEIMQIAFVNEDGEVPNNGMDSIEPNVNNNENFEESNSQDFVETVSGTADDEKVDNVPNEVDTAAADGGSLNESNTDVVTTLNLAETTVASGIDFITNPDFSKQQYYNWLTNFTELCKVVPMPLETSLFQKISQVHKTVSDVMATPSGVVADKENFVVLMNITKELSTIINEHLIFVMGKLDESEEGSESVILQNI